MRRYATLWLAWLGLALAGAPEADAQFLRFNGSLDLSAVQAEIEGEDQSSLQQRYNVNATRRITESILARASFRYFKFDLDQAEQLGVFREEVQPSAELSWRHSSWHASVTGQRRSVRTQISSGRLITDSFVADWRSKPSEWPTLSLRYDWQEVEDTGDTGSRDSRDARFVARVDVDREHESLDYTFTRRSSTNLLRDLESRELSHQIRFLGSHDLDSRDRWRLDTQYLFTHSDRVDEVRQGSVLLEEVPISRSLSGVDPAPEVGVLQVNPGLSDGNTSVGTVPAVEIGAGAFDRNVGADLGLERDAVAALFVYVDRVSSPTVTWTVYSSDDGLQWTRETTSPVRRFDPAFLRYEIEFTPFSARYVKVVNGGVNEAAGVLVTEIEVFEALQETGEVERDVTTHLLNSNLAWRASANFDASLIASARLEPQQGSVGDRESYDYAARLRWQQTDAVQWSSRWEQAWQRFENQRPTLRDDVLAGTVLYDPLPTLGSTASATWRRTVEGGRELRTVRSAFASVEAEPIPALDVVVDGLVSRLEDPLADQTSDVWTLRSSVDTEVTRSLRVLGSWAHQETRIRPSDDLVIRRTWTLDVDLQFTERIFARIGTSWVEESRRFSRRQDYLLNWRVGPRLVLTGQVIYDDASGGFRTDRTSFSATLDVNSRTTAYLRYAELEQGAVDEERTMSWQQGLRMTF